MATSALIAQITIAPENRQVLFPAGSAAFTVNAPAGTTWNVEVIRGIDLVGINSPDISWMSINSPTTQTGPGTVAYSYTENPELFPRTALFHIRIAGESTIVAEHRFVQEPTDSSVILSPTSIEIDGIGGLRTISVSIGPGANWSASSNQPWIEILTPPTVGPGNLQIRIQPNLTGAVRTGTVSVFGASVSISQDFTDATFTLGSASASFPFSGGNGTVGVTVTPPNVPWTAVSNSPFVTITNGGSYTGNANVAYSVATNPDEAARQGTITIAGQTFTVNQAANPGTPSTLTISPGSLSFLLNPAGGSTLTQTVQVGSSGNPLNFTVQINGAPWLSVNTTAGTTPATLSFTASGDGLPVGIQSGTVVFSTPDDGSVSITAAFEVRAEPAPSTTPLDVSPRSLYFNRVFGSGVPPVQRISLGNPNIVLDPQLQVSANGWMNTRVVQDDQGTAILASIREPNLQPGAYDATIRVTFRGGQFAPVEIPVRLVVLLGGSGPSIASGGVVNAATFRAGGAPGTWISVFGAGLASATQAWNPSTQQGSLLPTNLAGTEVFVAGVRAPISFVSPTQVNALVPGIPDRGWVPVEVRVNGQPTQGGFLFLRDADPALFVYSPANGIYPAAQHPDAVAVGPVNLFPGGPPSRPAQSTQIVVFYGTGFGPTAPSIDPATYFQGAAPLLDPEKVTVRVGPLLADVTFVGMVAPGLYQMNVRLPSLNDGDYFLNVQVDSLTTQPGRVLVIRQPQP